MRLVSNPTEVRALIADKRMPSLTWLNDGAGNFTGPYVQDPSRHAFEPVIEATAKQMRKGRNDDSPFFVPPLVVQPLRF